MATSKKIKKNNLSDQVCDAIRKSVKEGEWQPGSKLPSEAKLADMYGVNRLTIRIALQKLNAMGILETRAGEGTFVREFDFIKYINDVSDMIMSPDMLNDVWEFRKYFELECIRLTIQNAGDDDIRALQEKLEAFENVVLGQESTEGDYSSQLIEADLDFHYELCKSSKNLLFPLAFAAVREPIYQYVKAVFLVRKDKLKAKGMGQDYANAASLNTHRSILKGIKEKDYDLCEKAYLDMTDHNKL